MPERYLGRQLGRFRVDTLIGSGGFAWVYEGYDPTLDIKVAIKMERPTRLKKAASTDISCTPKEGCGLSSAL